MNIEWMAVINGIPSFSKRALRWCPCIDVGMLYWTGWDRCPNCNKSLEDAWSEANRLAMGYGYYGA